MTLSRITITGQVLRNPEKRFTESNLAISAFTLGFDSQDQEKTIRVFTMGKLAETTEQTVKKGQTVVIEGRLQTNSVKTDAGTDKKFFEINAQSVEVLGASTESAESANETEKQFDLNEEITNNDDLIGEDEIPF